jgi:FixJ family two-component response regulator
MASSKQPLIWIIDSNHWERANLRAVLIERGFEVEGFASIFHAVAMLHREIVEKPAAIVLETKNLAYQSQELDELCRIEAPVILLTGVYEGSRLANERKWAAVLRRPFTMVQVARTVECLVGQGPR